MSVRTLAASLLVSGLMAASTSAQGVEFTVQGTVGSLFCTQVNFPAPWESAFCGDVFFVRACLNPFVEDSDPSPGRGVYVDAVANIRVVIDGISVEETPVSSVVTIEDDSGPSGNDGIKVEFVLANGFSGDVRSSTFIGQAVVDDDSIPDCDEILAFSTPTWQSALVTPGTVSFAPFISCEACDVEPPECFLVIGDSPDFEPFQALGHAFTTQVGDVQQFFPVLLDDIPEFVIVDPPASTPTRGSTATSGNTSLGGVTPTAGTPVLRLEDVAQPQVFYAQVVMWNPGLFPENPEQSTHGLAIAVMNGQVFAQPYGDSDGGMEIWAETEWNDEGQKVLRLPFSIPGF